MTAPLKLDATSLACLACGVAVNAQDVHDRVPVDSVPLKSHPAGARAGDTVRFFMTRCPRCAATHKRALDLLAEHPRLVGRYGTAAEHRLECALTALDLIGVTPRLRSARDVTLLLAHLTIPGGLARWMARFSPIQAEGTDLLTAVASPWAHVGEGLRAQVRDGYGALLADQADIPVMEAAPDGEAGETMGCLFCGVHAVARTHTHPSPWTRVRTSRSVLGGSSTEPVQGHLCPPCSQARHDAGATGPTAMEGALLAFLGVRRRTLDPIRISGLLGWGGLPWGTTPNSRPWAHLADLEALREDLT